MSFFLSHTDSSGIYMGSPNPSGHFLLHRFYRFFRHLHQLPISSFFSLAQILPAFTWAPHQAIFSLSQRLFLHLHELHQVLFSLTHSVYCMAFTLGPHQALFSLTNRLFWHCQSTKSRKPRIKSFCTCSCLCCLSGGLKRSKIES
jgi:hypothetical protein